MMARYKMVALSSPIEGKEDAYNAWYQNVHMPEVVAMKEVLSAQRYRVRQEMSASKSWSYLCIYDVETDDLNGMMARMGENRASGKMTMTDTMEASGYAVIFEEHGSPLTHEQAVAKVGER
jgi:hypothetical protein